MGRAFTLNRAFAGVDVNFVNKDLYWQRSSQIMHKLFLPNRVKLKFAR